MRCARAAWPSSATHERVDLADHVVQRRPRSPRPRRGSTRARSWPAAGAPRSRGRSGPRGPPPVAARPRAARPAPAHRPRAPRARRRTSPKTSASQHTSATGASHGAPRSRPATSTADGASTLTGLVIALTANARLQLSSGSPWLEERADRAVDRARCRRRRPCSSCRRWPSRTRPARPRWGRSRRRS